MTWEQIIHAKINFPMAGPRQVFGDCVSDSYCGDVLGSTLGPALEVQCAQWMPIFPLLLLFPFTVAKITPTGRTIQKKKAVFSQYENSLANEKLFSWNKRLCN